MFANDPERMRKLMRGLASNDIGRDVLDAYDAIRAAGVNIRDLGQFATPPPIDIRAPIAELQKAQIRDWKFEAQAHFFEARDCLDAVLAALPKGPAAALRAMQSLSCNLTKLKRGNRPYELLKSLKNDLLPELEYSLIHSYYEIERLTLLEAFAAFDAAYRKLKTEAGGLDYDDLEENAVRLLEQHPEIRSKLHSQFEHVLMDEFQDTNGRQALLLDLLRPPHRFYAVGDINQSIYGFRHADPEVFRAYRDSVASQGMRLVELVENFRSRPEILRTVEEITSAAEGIEQRPLVAGLEFPNKQESSVEAVAAANLAMEAQWVASRIRAMAGSFQLRKGPAEFRDVALLVRNSEVLAEFTRAFDDAGIPYLVNSGKGFYETREIVDLIHLLRVVANPRDEISMAALLRSPFVQVSDEALLRLKLIGNVGSALEELQPARSRHSQRKMPRGWRGFAAAWPAGARCATTSQSTNCCCGQWTSAAMNTPSARAARRTSKNSWPRRAPPVRAKHSRSSSRRSTSCGNPSRASPTLRRKIPPMR